MSRSRRRAARYVLGALLMGGGVLHFATPGFYEQIMPPYLPWHRALIYVSGAAEVAGGAGLLMPAPVHRWAAVGVVALLVAVFPANVHMAHEAVATRGWAAPWTLGALARLPLQFVLIGVVWWAAGARRDGRAPRG